MSAIAHVTVFVQTPLCSTSEGLHSILHVKVRLLARTSDEWLRDTLGRLIDCVCLQVRCEGDRAHAWTVRDGRRRLICFARVSRLNIRFTSGGSRSHDVRIPASDPAATQLPTRILVMTRPTPRVTFLKPGHLCSCYPSSLAPYGNHRPTTTRVRLACTLSFTFDETSAACFHCGCRCVKPIAHWEGRICRPI